MRTNVTFRYPAQFVGTSEDGGGVLAVSGAHWFAGLLKRVPGLQVNDDLCQEDWGVVVFVQRNKKKFWIGLSAEDTDGRWLAHIHHGSFAWLQWFSSSGKVELRRLLADVHEALVREPAVTEIAWHEASALTNQEPTGFSTPNEG